MESKDMPNPSCVPRDPSLCEIEHNADPALPKWRLIVLITSLSTGLFLSLLDSSIVATALYEIGTDFSSPRTATWTALSYTLAYVGFTVPFAKLSDVAGRRASWLAASGVFLAASLACGSAGTLAQLVAFRAVQGVGGSGLYSLTVIVLPEVAPRRVRRWVGGIAGLVVAVAGVMGPVVGGLVTRYTTWRWIFWINGPVGVVAVVLFLAAWPRGGQIERAERRSWKRLDFVGALLLIAASVLVVFAFQEGGLETDGWSTALFLAPLLLGCASWALLLGWECAISLWFPGTVNALFPPRLMSRRVYVFTALTTLATGYVNFTTIYSLPIHFQLVNGASSLTAAVGLLPLLASAAVGSLLGGMTQQRTFPALATSGGLMALGSGLLSTLAQDDGIPARTYGFEVLLGLGLGLSVSTSSLAAVVNSATHDHAIAQGIIAQCRVLGGSVGIAASTAILGVAAEHTASVDPLVARREAYAEAFSKTMWVSAVVSCVGLVLCIGTWGRTKDVRSEDGVTGVSDQV